MFHHHATLLAGLLSYLILIVGTQIISLPPSHAADEDCTDQEGQREENAHQECIQDVHNVDNYFYAWPTNPYPAEDSLMNALFPDLTQFQLAWETYPLLSRVSFTQQNRPGEVQPSALDQIPTLVHNRSIISKLKTGNENNGDPLLSLFEVSDTPTVLSQPMDHGSDYKLAKKIILPPEHPKAGEEYTGVLPQSHFTVEEAVYAFNQGAFSLIINNMQRRWKPIARMARVMEEEFGAMGVGVNLYATPEVVLEEADIRKHGEVRQGFEAHWDWMDAIVVQLSGRKRWSVAREPSIYLSGKYQKRKPDRKEVEALQHYSEFTLCPGDVLYIPRGHIHNASTVIFDKFDNNGGESELLDLDGCPSYPTDSASAELLSNRLFGPSLHLTFGLLQDSDGSMEALLHHALDTYFASVGGSSKHERVAIPAKTSCFSLGQTVMDYDIAWKSVFHHLLAEVARREHWCDKLSSRAFTRNTGKHNRCGGTAILRQSVPLMLLTKNKDKKSTIGDDDVQQQYLNLKQSYLVALDSFASSASITKTIDFILHLLHPPSDDELIFHYPGYSKNDVILCPDLLKTLSDETFNQLLHSFHQFARDNFHQALKGLHLWGKETRKNRRQRQQLALELVGQ